MTDVLVKSTLIIKNVSDESRSNLLSVLTVKKNTQSKLINVQYIRRLSFRSKRLFLSGLLDLLKIMSFSHYSVRQMNPGLLSNTRLSLFLKMTFSESENDSRPWTQQTDPSRES